MKPVDKNVALGVLGFWEVVLRGMLLPVVSTACCHLIKCGRAKRHSPERPRPHHHHHPQHHLQHRQHQTKHVTPHLNNSETIIKQSQVTRSSRIANLYHVSMPVVAAILCYVNSLHGDLVHDDVMALVKNPDVRGNTPVWRLLQNDFWGKPMWDNSSHKSYRPLTVLSFR